MSDSLPDKPSQAEGDVGDDDLSAQFAENGDDDSIDDPASHDEDDA